MRTWLAIVFVVIATTSAIALDTGNAPPPKPTTTYPANIPNPDRQGGDTIADAAVIPSLPYSDTGTTAATPTTTTRSARTRARRRPTSSTSTRRVGDRVREHRPVRLRATTPSCTSTTPA